MQSWGKDSRNTNLLDVPLNEVTYAKYIDTTDAIFLPSSLGFHFTDAKSSLNRVI